MQFFNKNIIAVQFLFLHVLDRFCDILYSVFKVTTTITNTTITTV